MTATAAYKNSCAIQQGQAVYRSEVIDREDKADRQANGQMFRVLYDMLFLILTNLYFFEVSKQTRSQREQKRAFSVVI